MCMRVLPQHRTIKFYLIMQHQLKNKIPWASQHFYCFLPVASLNHPKSTITLYCDHIRTHRLLLNSRTCKETHHSSHHQHSPMSMEQLSISKMVWNKPLLFHVSWRFQLGFSAQYLRFCFGRRLFSLCLLLLFVRYFLKVVILSGCSKLFTFKRTHNHHMRLLSALLSEKRTLLISPTEYNVILRITA